MEQGRFGGWGLRRGTAAIVMLAASGCGGPSAASPSVGVPTPTEIPARSGTPTHGRVEADGSRPVLVGEPIEVAALTGRIVFDDFEDVYVMNADGSDVRAVATQSGAEFDGAWSPDGAWITYRDSTRGINEDDEIFVVAADGTGRRNLTNHPANDWGPDWSPDGRTIVFNSDRAAGAMGGYLMDADGSNLRRIEVETWVEYPAFSPDGTRIAFMSHAGSDYDIHVADLASGSVERLTDAPGSDGWPAWSPDGSTIAFTSERDDCRLAPSAADCWRDDEGDEYRDVWLMDVDGTDQRRLTPEAGQFVTWSPDGHYLLVSGRALFVVRPDGTGRTEIRGEGVELPLGGIPDWTD